MSYRWKSEEFRGPLREIIQTAFPVILQVALRIQNEDSLDAAELMRIILKTYSSAVHVSNISFICHGYCKPLYSD